MTADEILASFDRRTNPGNYTDVYSCECQNIAEPNDSLLDPVPYPESRWELDPEKVREFIKAVWNEAFLAGQQYQKKA